MPVKPLDRIAAVIESELRGPVKAVAFVLAYRDGNAGLGCFVSVPRLARESGLSERSVRNALRTLQERGLIEVHHTPGKGSARRIFPDRVKAWTPAPRAPLQEMPPAGDAGDPGTSCTPPLQEVPPTPAGGAAKQERNRKGTGKEQEALTLLAPVEVLSAANEWEELHAAYRKLPGTKRLQGPGKGLGRNLQRLLDVHGLQDAEVMLQWMAYATGCPKAEQLEESGHRTLATVGREAHVEAYWIHVARWVKRGKPGLPDGRKPPRRRRILNAR